LTTALLVNPFSPDEMAGAIHEAIRMPGAERRSRMEQAREAVRRHNIYAWAADILSTLQSIDSAPAAPVADFIEPEARYLTA